ncbi:MAG TPA: DUF370 domain-containing protein [Peptococcaceae bacterium]|jgi:hypothetical protein|nr:DUF370 domain-containing protein [Peptococcaceae bacterium]HBI26950.1 DUF370 domain-containing protein [Peptococcaceae bacterium]
MFLHIGRNMIIPLNDVIAILDLGSGDQQETTKEYLKYASWYKEIVYVNKNKNKRSAVITDKKIFFTHISVYTLIKRSQSIY